eukprot:3511254-Prymnesium_polylepis.1
MLPLGVSSRFSYLSTSPSSVHVANRALVGRVAGLGKRSTDPKPEFFSSVPFGPCFHSSNGVKNPDFFFGPSLYAPSPPYIR